MGIVAKMRMIVIGDKRHPLGSGKYRHLVEFLAAPTVDANGCHVFCPLEVRQQWAMCPRLGRGRHVILIAYEILSGEDATVGTVHRCARDHRCVNLAHLEFVPNKDRAPKAQPDATACGAGHPWTAETIYELTAIRDGAKVAERQCRVCRNDRKRAARAREKRWRAMGWTP